MKPNRSVRWIRSLYVARSTDLVPRSPAALRNPNQPLIGQSPQAARLTGGLHYKALTELLSGTGNELGIKCFERRLNLLNVRNEIRRHVPGHR